MATRKQILAEIRLNPCSKGKRRAIGIIAGCVIAAGVLILVLKERGGPMNLAETTRSLSGGLILVLKERGGPISLVVIALIAVCLS